MSSWRKCNSLSRLLHFWERNEGCAFINDRKLIAGDAVGWSTSFAWKPKTTVKRRKPNARCRTLPDILAIDERFGITGAYSGPEVLVGDRLFLLQGYFPYRSGETSYKPTSGQWCRSPCKKRNFRLARKQKTDRQDAQHILGVLRIGISGNKRPYATKGDDSVTWIGRVK